MALDLAAMTTPRRHQRTRRAALPPGVVYVGRPTVWGNPYRVGAFPNWDRRVVVDLYRNWLLGTPAGRDVAARARRELRGADLACWCPLDGAPCHADVLLAIANDGGTDAKET